MDFLRHLSSGQFAEPTYNKVKSKNESKVKVFFTITYMKQGWFERIVVLSGENQILLPMKKLLLL